VGYKYLDEITRKMKCGFYERGWWYKQGYFGSVFRYFCRILRFCATTMNSFLETAILNIPNFRGKTIP
jgi:hypothetical protein